jgi:hypothetical protein
LLQVRQFVAGAPGRLFSHASTATVFTRPISHAQNVLSDFLLVDPYRPGSLSAAFDKLNLPIVLK